MSNNTSAKRDFKKGISCEENRRRREKEAVQIRKEKKEEGIAKKRGSILNNFVNESIDNDVLKDEQSREKTYSISDIPELLKGLSQDIDLPIKITSLRGFRRLLSIEKNPPVQQCIDCGAVPHFVNCLQRADSMELQFEAAWALTNIASTDRTRFVVECGSIPHLVNLLVSPNPDIREQSAWCLGNVAGDSSQLRDIVLGFGALDPLVANVAQPATISLLRNCTWSLSNFCRGKPQPPINVLSKALTVLGQIINCKTNVDNETVVDATWALSYVSDGDDNRIQAIVDLKIIDSLVSMLSSDSISVIVPALRTLGNIVSGNDSQTQAVVQANVIPALVPLLSNSKKNIRKETCWMLSNIAAGSEEQMNLLFSEPNLITKVLLQLSSAAEWDVRKEATWVISNIITAGKKQQIGRLVEQGVIGPLVELLEVGEVKVLLIALESLECILKTIGNNDNNNGYNTITTLIDEAGGVDKIENLQSHEDQGVYERAVRIIERYFGTEDEENEIENMAPTILNSQNKYSFGFNTTGKANIDFNMKLHDMSSLDTPNFMNTNQFKF